MTSQPLARRFALLALFASVASCALPLNTAPREWSRTAGMAIDRPSLATGPDVLAMQHALAAYFYALGVLWDGAALSFNEVEFRSLASRAGAPEAAAITELAAGLRAANLDTPPRWMSTSSSSAQPAYEDRRLVNLLQASDGAVQTLLASLARASLPGPRPQIALPEDPILLEVAREAGRQAASARAARATYARLLAEIGTVHAALKAQGGMITHRSTELELRQAEDRLRRGMAELPPEAPRGEQVPLATMPLP